MMKFWEENQKIFGRQQSDGMCADLLLDATGELEHEDEAFVFPAVGKTADWLMESDECEESIDSEEDEEAFVFPTIGKTVDWLNEGDDESFEDLDVDVEVFTPPQRIEKYNELRDEKTETDLDSRELDVENSEQEDSPEQNPENAYADSQKRRQNPDVTPKAVVRIQDPDKYNMHSLEDIMLEKLPIKRIHGKLYYYSGRIYMPLDRELFMLQMRICLPDNVERAVPTVGRMEELYKYICTNPKIEMKISPKLKMFTSYLIAFQNGIYDVRRNKLIPFSMDIPMLFDIDADYIDGECETPCFDKFMADVSGGDHDIVELILQMLGYLMMQGMDGKCFFVLGTAPNSGKSVWGEFISKLFQEDAVGTVPLTELGNRFSLGGLWKRAINISMDLPTRVLNEQEVSQIKMLTGEARMRTEEKYEPVTTTFMHCKYVFATNGQINLKVPDDAFWDRLVFVPFMKSIPEHRQDRFLLSKLWKEKDGIVSKAARAAGTLVRNNYRFKLPEISDHIISEWKMYINESITGFLRSRCVVSPDKSIFSEDIYNAYKLYCTEQEMTVQTQTALSNKITKISGVCKRKERRNADGNPRWKFEGIGLSE